MTEFEIDSEYKLILNADTKLWDVYQDGNALSHSTEKLYKFYNLTIENLDALLNHYLYLANPSDFNDPFDCNLNLVEDMDKKDWKGEIRRNNISNIGVCSFSEIIDDPVMWAHYTTNYYGFALQFKGTKLDTYLDKERFTRNTLTRVIYPDKPKKILHNYPFAQHYVFTTKFKRWSYEKEWRIICELLTKERKIIYTTDSVEAIFIGHKIPDRNPSGYSLLLQIQELAFPHLPVYVVYPDPDNLSLKFEKVWN